MCEDRVFCSHLFIYSIIYVVSSLTVCALTSMLFWFLFPSLLPSSRGNNSKNKTLPWVCLVTILPLQTYDDVIKWKHFPRYWPFGRGIHRPVVNSPHKGQGRETLMFSLICAWINVWVNNRAHYDVTVMQTSFNIESTTSSYMITRKQCAAKHKWQGVHWQGMHLAGYAPGSIIPAQAQVWLVNKTNLSLELQMIWNHQY